METITYKPHWTCSRRMEITLDGDVVHDVRIHGIGCDGNIQGVIALVKGQRAQDVIARLEGIKCGPRPTSCPDQLAQALKKALARR